MPNPPPRRRPTTAGAPSASRPRPAPPPAPEPSPESGASLQVTAGPSAGTHFPMATDEIVVGRATDATLSIPDTSVSRKHCAFKREGNGWVVADLGSGNGTLVNGEPVTEDRPLMSGDVITIGDTVLEFKDESNATLARAPAPAGRPGHDSTNPVAQHPAPPVRRSMAGRPDVRARLGRAGAPAPDPAAQAKKKRMILLGVGAVLLILVGAIVIRQQNIKKQEQIDNENRRRQQALVALQTTFQDGKNFASKGQWQDAKARFDEIAEAAQEYPPLAASLQTYVDRANKEIPNQANLAEAEKALSENRIGDAAAALAKVTEDTQMFEKRRDLKLTLREKLSARIIEARTAMAGGKREDYVKAQEITDDVLKADAENRDAKVVNEQAKAEIDKIDHPVIAVKVDNSKPWDPAVARYRAGDATGALAILDECGSKKSLGKDAAKCKSMAGDVREAMQLSKKVESLDAKELSKLIRLDKGLAGGATSNIGRQAATQAGTKFCKMASNEKQKGNWAKAADWANQALDADPDSNCAKALVSDLRGRCKDTYMRGYALKDSQPDDALPFFKDAMAVCAPGDDYRDKAAHWVDMIEKGH